jgi:hypothetical protein
VGNRHIAIPQRDIVRIDLAVSVAWLFDEERGEEALLRSVAYAGVPRGQRLQIEDRKLARHCAPGQKAAFM